MALVYRATGVRRGLSLPHNDGFYSKKRKGITQCTSAWAVATEPGRSEKLRPDGTATGTPPATLPSVRVSISETCYLLSGLAKLSPPRKGMLSRHLGHI